MTNEAKSHNSAQPRSANSSETEQKAAAKQSEQPRPAKPAAQPLSAAQNKKNAPAEDNQWAMTFFPAALAAAIVSFLIRWFWNDLHDLFGTYPSDVWYIHINYGWFLVNYDNFATEYPAPMFMIFKSLSWICRFFPATEPAKYGGFIYPYETWLIVNSVFLGALGILSAKLLYDIQKHLVYSRKNLFWYILSPTFVYFLIFNYDIIPVVCCLASFLFILRKNYMLSFIMLGAGTAFKVFPGALLFIFILDIPAKKRIEAILWFLAPIVIMNVPFMIRDMNTWLFPYTWQMGFDSSEQPGHIIYHLTQLLGKPAALAVMGAFGLWALYFIIKSHQYAILSRFTHDSPNPEAEDDIQSLPVAEWYAPACLILLLLFMLTKNVFSPQYIIWILPFLVLFVPHWINENKTGLKYPAYPFWGISIAVELINCLEGWFLDYWRTGRMEGLIAIRSIRELAMLALLAYCFFFIKKLKEKSAGASGTPGATVNNAS